jgi:hypothetical protein
MKISRRDALKFGGLAALGTAGLTLPLGRSVSGSTPSMLSSGDFPKRFAYPFQYQTVMTPKDKFDTTGKKIAECYDLRAQANYANILPFKKTPVLGYDGKVPGHRIDVEQGMPVELTMRNELTTPHPLYNKPVQIGLAAAVRRLRQRHDGAEAGQDLQVPEQPAGADAVVPRPRGALHRPERLLRPGGAVPPARPAGAGEAADVPAADERQPQPGHQQVRRGHHPVRHDVQGRRFPALRRPQLVRPLG